jgi:hypothetical protein
MNTVKQYRFEIKANPFHGGAHIAYSGTLESAVRRISKDSCVNGKSGCTCGGPIIVDLSDYEWEPDEWNKALERAWVAVRGY